MTRDDENYRSMFHALKGGANLSASQKSIISAKILSPSKIESRYLWLVAGFLFSRADIKVIDAMTRHLSYYIETRDDENTSALILALAIYMEVSDLIERQLIQAIEPHFSKECEESFELAASALGRLALSQRSRHILQIMKEQAKIRLIDDDFNEAKIIVGALLKATSGEAVLAEKDIGPLLSIDAVERLDFCKW